ncbi:hypothetical protein B0H14DRAFT_2559511 [Mycena olivaceomarginata]|nr:hypothetical protein B0H14DRAFT_2559511 [Mycena olivaceomarginata]
MDGLTVNTQIISGRKVPSKPFPVTFDDSLVLNASVYGKSIVRPLSSRILTTILPSNTPAEPQYLRASAYLPPTFVASHPGSHPAIARIAQTFIEAVGVPTVQQWRHNALLRGWPLTQQGVGASSNPTSNVPLTPFSPPLPPTSFLAFRNHTMDHDDVDEDRFIINYDDNDVNGMIRAVMTDHPEATRKFLVQTPALMAKTVKTRGTERKNNSDDEGTSKPKGKARKKKTSDDSDADEPPPSITYYVFIPKLLPATSTKRNPRSKVAEEDKFIQRGPFSVPTAAPYSELINAIAAALPCLRENILETQIVWKPKKPKNAEKLALGKAAGYKVLITEMEDKAPSACQVLLYMPAPAKPLEETPSWIPPPAFDFSELEPVGASDSVQQQKIAFNKVTKDHRAELEEKYPIGNHTSFPQLRVFTQPRTGFLFDLNNLCMGVWSAGMALPM